MFRSKEIFQRLWVRTGSTTSTTPSWKLSHWTRRQQGRLCSLKQSSPTLFFLLLYWPLLGKEVSQYLWTDCLQSRHFFSPSQQTSSLFLVTVQSWVLFANYLYHGNRCCRSRCLPFPSQRMGMGLNLVNCNLQGLWTLSKWHRMENQGSRSSWRRMRIHFQRDCLLKPRASLGF